MNDDQIQYDPENYAPPGRREEKNGLVGMLIRMGVAKDEKQANTVFIVVLAICIVVGVGIWFVL